MVKSLGLADKVKGVGEEYDGVFQFTIFCRYYPNLQMNGEEFP